MSGLQEDILHIGRGHGDLGDRQIGQTQGGGGFGRLICRDGTSEIMRQFDIWALGLGQDIPGAHGLDYSKGLAGEQFKEHQCGHSPGRSWHS